MIVLETCFIRQQHRPLVAASEVEVAGRMREAA
jgi:hypothetical protein